MSGVDLPDERRFRPVVAVDVDGVLRVEGPDRDEVPPEGVFRQRITVRRKGYPLAFHHEPEWDEHDQWHHTHWFSGIGAEWIRELLDRGVEVAWATTWQHAANLYFAGPLGVPHLPVAVEGDRGRFTSSSIWKSAQLATKFPGRPLLWADDMLNRRALDRLDRTRRPRDRALTHFHWVRNWWTGIDRDDVTEMNQWLDLASTAEGHGELRRRRRREQARDRYRAHRRGR